MNLFLGFFFVCFLCLRFFVRFFYRFDLRVRFFLSFNFFRCFFLRVRIEHDRCRVQQLLLRIVLRDAIQQNGQIAKQIRGNKASIHEIL